MQKVVEAQARADAAEEEALRRLETFRENESSSDEITKRGTKKLLAFYFHFRFRLCVRFRFCFPIRFHFALAHIVLTFNPTFALRTSSVSPPLLL